MSVMTTYSDSFDMSSWSILTDFSAGDFGFESANIFTVFNATQKYVFVGSGFTYDSNGVPTDGTITHIKVIDQSGGTDNVQVTGLNLTVQQLQSFALTNDLSGFENAVLGNGGDRFNVGLHGAAQHLVGTAGDDVFKFDGGPDVSSADTFDGGGGMNTVIFGGPGGNSDIYLDVMPGMLKNIQDIKIETGFKSDFLMLSDPNISGGKTLTIDAHTLGSATPITVEAFYQSVNVNFIGTAGDDQYIGSAGDDQITGGLGGDVLSGFTGNNTFIYHSAAESTGMSIDGITDFVASKDHFQMPHAVNAMDAPITTGTLDYGPNFDTELQAAVKGHLNAGDALLFTPDSGNMAAFTLLVVDENGHAGYQPGHDIVIQLGGPHTDLTGFSTANFIV